MRTAPFVRSGRRERFAIAILYPYQSERIGRLEPHLDSQSTCQPFAPDRLVV